MLSYTKMALISIAITSIGLFLTILLFFLALNQPILFWTLILAIWIVLSIISGILAETFKECAIISTFNAGINLVLLFLTLLISTTLINEILESFNISTGITSDWGLILSSITTAIIITSIIFIITISFSILSFLIKDRIMKTKGEFPEKVEQEFYSKYETPNDAGYYHRSKKKEDFDS
ncbi:MAG: hypothetical protein JXA54_13165 [Candidatus Heimdallarchaeota archaeon]|nr:hypothetical protein [Candidatus Heimdallarchaeota archaeon]